ncbi:hypothetical protein EQG49_10450 [Periweissella cryptocerci]|uniref:YdhG-like domain-containing protein n=1 Tax=Periweissella cryptocerci TaxID=2506420 RepID=A0A4P6YVQ8_9LACO|nr:YdeI/OmpD-associated family protein [Periweissella cryptocerci]QBO36833.1 hypothetical protein EQG49_10450 [Periweissella cryptocerci]
MAAVNINPKVDEFVANTKVWQAEIIKLRQLLLASELQEDYKWRKPTYSYNEQNLFGILPLKNHLSLLFMKGSVLDDPAGLLIQPTEDSQVQRQMRFTSLDDLLAKEGTVVAYIAAAVAAEKAGIQPVYAEPKAIPTPLELQTMLDDNDELHTAFDRLTPGRQKAYKRYFGDAKQSATRVARIEKFIPKILAGKGLAD